jgi:hypothetical protein
MFAYEMVHSKIRNSAFCLEILTLCFVLIASEQRALTPQTVAASRLVTAGLSGV